MRRKIVTCLLLVIVFGLLLVACSPSDGALSGEATKKAAPSSQQSETKTHYGYVFTLNPNTLKINSIYPYTQNQKVTSALKKYKSLYKKEPEYTFVLENNKQKDSVSFSPETVSIVEDFQNKENRLVSYDRVSKENIFVYLTRTSPLNLNKDVIITIKNKENRVISKNTYSNKITTKLITPKEPSNEEIYFNSLCPNLQEVFQGHNRFGDQRINLIFVGHGYNRDSSGQLEFVSNLSQLIDKEGIGFTPPAQDTDSSTPTTAKTVGYNMAGIMTHGLFGEWPFIGNSNLFNFWYEDMPAPRIVMPFEEEEAPPLCETRPASDYTCSFPNTFVANIINTPCQGNARFEGQSYVSLPLPATETEIASSVRTFVHEMGHSIGSLKDEYVAPIYGDWPGDPNCASSVEEMNAWGWDPAGKIYGGCSYVENNYRPTRYSIMNGEMEDNDFDYINEAHLCAVLAEKTGKFGFPCGDGGKFWTFKEDYS